MGSSFGEKFVQIFDPDYETQSHKRWKRQHGVETQEEYNRRHRINEYKAQAKQARDNITRVRAGYKPGSGHVASDGNVYTHKETPEEYYARKAAKAERDLARSMRCGNGR